MGECVVFVRKLLASLLFPGLFFALLILTRSAPLGGLARYDALFVGALGINLVLLWAGIESWDELKVIGMFHLVGLLLELFKTHPAIGSWSYPEACVLRLGGVPLYSGFMYATVASFLCQAWRRFDVELEAAPGSGWSLALCGLIYVNFFTHHWLWDARWALKLGAVLVFWRTAVRFRVTGRERRVGLLWLFVAVGGMVWVAENIATRFGAWVYPGQEGRWRLVSLGKMSSWSLLVILSFVLVMELKGLKRWLRGGSGEVAGGAPEAGLDRPVEISDTPCHFSGDERGCAGRGG